MGPTSVRRNLFHQNLSRRPASAGPSNGTVPLGTSSLSNRPSHRLKPTSSDSIAASRNARLVESREIAVRERAGGYKFDAPTKELQPLIGEDGEELGDLDEEGAGGILDSELTVHEKEKFDAALGEMMFRNRNKQSSGEPDELLNIVHQNLQRQVASLEDDNWMFEPEKDTHS
ncbi:hypothetical protein NUU61_007140 [Penicillium alfredii]|uniref:Uncharacterized protein n=1 Tax=Penicillium alfredii TaxID=1506179 RepID=A0A9W9F287_9EURO|nr:uncharacterized protein NUU61_007140 [Penicillium alfredii]KAJ5092270.1 hypothetical protein NUU61_007140 [Penicillium alfredii]